MNYYNEFDPKAAEWLRQLIKQGLIPNGDVDERSIADVRADELRGYTQCHFFAGIGGWSLALQLAGWPEDRPVWTGSCPCQPFSTAGKRKAFDDERDLWPVFFELIKKAKPKVVFGEQVASSEVVGSSIEAAFVNAVREGDFARANKIASQLSRSPTLHYYSRWVDRVYTDMETSGYAMRTEVLGAHSVGAPHQRQRLYWRGSLLDDVADGNGKRLDRQQVSEMSRGDDCTKIARSGGIIGMAENSNGRGCGGRGDADCSWIGREVQAPGLGDDCGMADTIGEQRNGLGQSGERRSAESANGSLSNLPWQSSIRILCRDNKVRRVPAESLLFSLADGLSSELDRSRFVGISDVGGFPLTTQKEGRPMLLKGYGNAIVPQVAAEWVMAFDQSIKEMSYALR